MYLQRKKGQLMQDIKPWSWTVLGAEAIGSLANLLTLSLGEAFDRWVKG